jgi:feruloyl esterase
MGHPEKLIDFGYISVHAMTVVAKALIAAFYEGCSSGGGQALMEAQRYPKDYDGIVA